MSLDIATVTSQDYMVLNQSAKQNLTPEMSSEEFGFDEHICTAAENKPALSSPSARNFPRFPTFRSGLTSETLQILIRKYSR